MMLLWELTKRHPKLLKSKCYVINNREEQSVDFKRQNKNIKKILYREVQFQKCYFERKKEKADLRSSHMDGVF